MNEKKFRRRLQRYPAIADLRELTQRRLPKISWEYLDCGTGDEQGVRKNINKMAQVSFLPKFMKGDLKPKLKTKIFGTNYDLPFGIAPVGLTGLMWPKAELILAKTALEYKIPFCLSTVATQKPEVVGPISGDVGWFQLYPPRKPEIRNNLIKRAEKSGFKTLVVTADVPVGSRRERTSRAGLETPPRITPGFLYEAFKHPTWTIQTLLNGLPKLRTIEQYVGSKKMGEVASYVGQELGGTLSWDYLREVRDLWKGPLVLKGILEPDDADKAISIGVDGIQVSNHGARQFDGTPAAIDVLPVIADAVGGRAKILFDSGVRTGLDILRALALGADFVFLGRPFLYGACAFGKSGGSHTIEILKADLETNLINLGCDNLNELPQPVFEKIILR